MPSPGTCPVILPRGAALAPGEAALLRRTVAGGGVVVFPTETFYALGANPSSPAGLDRVIALKGRPPSKPLLVLVDGPGRVGDFAASVSGAHRALMERFWPGPLTLLFPARPDLPLPVVSELKEVALRVPGSGLCRVVLAAAGGALTGTSANRSGDRPPESAAAALASLGHGADLAVDGGTLPPSAVSTILAVREGRAQVLREGAVEAAELEKYVTLERGSERS